ncbi:MAG TPA: hypothetical protein VJ728_13745 [Candidatus Binataceae bacterium]|nr:hypothetical protein [Candidatus Binataceae bacterium]
MNTVNLRIHHLSDIIEAQKQGSCMNRCNYLGINFDIWNAREAWFWRVVNPHSDAGVVGATAREIEAIREACQSIEQMASRPPVAETCSNVS